MNESRIGKRVIVIFNYDMSVKYHGKITRDDMQAPWTTEIELDDGRVIDAGKIVNGLKPQYQLEE